MCIVGEQKKYRKKTVGVISVKIDPGWSTMKARVTKQQAHRQDKEKVLKPYWINIHYML